MFRETGSRFKGAWVNGIAQGPGQLIHSNHRYQGHWLDGSLQGKWSSLFSTFDSMHNYEFFRAYL